MTTSRLIEFETSRQPDSTLPATAARAVLKEAQGKPAPTSRVPGLTRNSGWAAVDREIHAAWTAGTRHLHSLDGYGGDFWAPRHAMQGRPPMHTSNIGVAFAV
jgi:hypothetical protein